MRKTSAQKYNDRMADIFKPELERLSKREEISQQIINEVKNHEGAECHLINKVGKVIDCLIK